MYFFTCELTWMLDPSFHIIQGGCPTAANCTAALEVCDPYKVDFVHWELSKTEMGVEYGGGLDAIGKDVKANKDDRYSVSQNCLYDDDGDKAGNEWTGAWLHSNPVEINSTGDWDGEGCYAFEMSRRLQTLSEGTDAQLWAGEAIDFGFAFWVSLHSQQLSSPRTRK